MADFSKSNAVVNRYIKALYEVAEEKGLAEQVLSELTVVKEAVLSDENYVRLLERLSLVKEEGYAFADLLSSQMKISPIVSNFLKLLAKNKRFSLLIEFCDAYAAYVDKAKGKTKIFVKYAKEFTETEKESLLNNLKPLLGDAIECVTEQDSSLIDGIILQYGSKILDYSVKSKLIRLRAAIRGEGHEDKVFRNQLYN